MSRDSADILTDPPPPAADARIAYGPEPLQFGDLRVPHGDGPFPLARRAARRLLAGDLQPDPHRPPVRRARATPASPAGTSSTAASAIPAASGRRPREDLALALEHVDRLPFAHDGRAVLVGHSAGGQLALWAAKRAGLPVVALAPVSDVRDAVDRRGPDERAGPLHGARALRRRLAARAAPARRARRS